MLDNEHGEWGKTVVESNDSQNSENIPSISINEIVQQYNLQKIDIIKLDIEGGEKIVFENDLEWISITSLIIVEIHDNIFSGLSDKIKETLESHGFKHIFKGENNYFYKGINFSI